ncbi:MAG: tRNA adenosine(34) deaminase TadA [Pseudomonadales bacterium]|jgi:tRNA(adenine34) deaminase|nr:tRNA adenosine(34) deaminase TadA [Pseudomonadales bacterium]MDP7359382.1 tRNA adenosine(34) deaminase TadA [Pseudomonadales bacterium]MDP7596362.1 tRNA adenosine(34) deaminase TadA [Pseudomonadales bacterium]HJN48926.1 tRNA adenosine(34) deaminase TadA [Pseudomonadales bacterium]|tara:strand:- start:1779 stop:2258 length:480 start_codon:yes stop_codon:yes gene_type:complete
MPVKMSESDKEDLHITWMAHAIQLARRSEQSDEVPVGAVLVADDQIVGEGWNQPISLRDPTAHAEILALRQAANRLDNYRLVDCTLYVTIEPCTMCAGALVHARIKRLVFGALEKKAGAIVSSAEVLNNPNLNHRVEVVSGVLAEECGALVRSYFQLKR